MKLTTQHAFCALFSLNYQLVYGKMEEADTLVEDLCRDKVRSIHILYFTLSGSPLVEQHFCFNQNFSVNCQNFPPYCSLLQNMLVQPWNTGYLNTIIGVEMFSILGKKSHFYLLRCCEQFTLQVIYLIPQSKGEEEKRLEVTLSPPLPLSDEDKAQLGCTLGEGQGLLNLIPYP